MRILRLHIDKYKQLNDFRIDMSHKEERKDALNLTFLIGENGTGKSSFLEALSIIFTKAMMNQEVGFGFTLEYQIKEKQSSGTIVKLKNKKLKNNQFNLTYQLKSNFSDDFGKSRSDSFAERTDLHPDKIFTVGSGPHNNFERVLITDPIQILAEKIINSNEYSKNGTEQNIGAYEDILFNPKVLNFDSESLMFVLLSILYFPSEDLLNQEIYQDQEADQNEENEVIKIKKTRNEKFESNISILKSSVSMFTEKGFSININSKIYEDLSNGLYNSSIKDSHLKVFLKNIKNLFELVSSNITETEKKSHFFFSVSKLKDIHDELIQYNLTSLNILSTLMMAYRIGLIESTTMYLTHNDSKFIVTDKSFSDGEWFWLSKIGLIILIQSSINDDFLIIFDEPDAFLNEGWIEDFVFSLNEFSIDVNDTKSTIKNHDYFIATHSTLMLTDAMQHQVYKFEKNKNQIECDKIDFSTFGADRGYISSKLFLNDKRTGRFVEDKIDKAFRDKNSSLIDELIEELGQGYDRFLIQELKMHTNSNRY